MYKEYITYDICRNERKSRVSSSQVWDQLWGSMRLSSDSQLRGLKYATQWQEIAKVYRHGWSVLEAGCGLGQWVRFFEKRGLRPIGLDYSKSTYVGK